MDAAHDFFVFSFQGSPVVWVADCVRDCQIVNSFTDPLMGAQRLVAAGDRVGLWTASGLLRQFNNLPASFNLLESYVPNLQGLGISDSMMAYLDGSLNLPFGSLIVSFCDGVHPCENPTFVGTSPYTVIGTAVAVSENLMAVMFTNGGGSNHVVIYYCLDNYCTEYATIPDPVGPSISFGTVMSFSSGTLVISDPYNGDGVVYIYSKKTLPQNNY